MTKVKNNPAMEGGVNRAVDFSLKKEDLMLLILEGRKENMEEEIGKMQTVSTNLRSELSEAEVKFREKMTKLVLKSLNAEAKQLARGFSKKDGGEDDHDLEKIFNIKLNAVTEEAVYTAFVSQPIGDGKGSTYIKQQVNKNVRFQSYNAVSVSIDMSLHGKTFANKADIYYRKDYVRACSEYSKEFTIVSENLDRDFLKTIKEYQNMQEIADKLAANESLLSDILAEYDLFNRNQPRAKAKMIKEVLGRDDEGSALLESIITAASGRKLLAPSK